MIYAWIMNRLPAEDDKGGMTRDQFDHHLNLPDPALDGRRLTSAAAPAGVDSGVEALAQFSAFG